LKFIAMFLAAFAATGALAGPKEELAKFGAAAGPALAAYKKADYKTAQAGFAQAVAHAPQRPRALYYLASSAARRGDIATAVTIFNRYAAMGLESEPPTDFTALPGAKSGIAHLAASKNPLCPCTVFFQGPAQPFVAEGLAHDGGRVFVGGVVPRRIVAVENGRASVFVDRLPGAYSPFGMVADRSRALLWVSAAVLPLSEGATKDTHDTSALIAFDLTHGALRKVYPLTGKHDLGDVALAADGTVYVSDSLEGSVFRLMPNGAVLERVGSAGMLSSAQGMAVSADGRQLLVADYEMGLLCVDLATGKLQTIAIPNTVTTIGIDGLARLANGDFVATQNGTKTARILRLRLSPDWSRLKSLTVLAANTPDVAAPSLIMAEGSDVYLVGVSQWASFGDAPKPIGTVPAWKIVRIASH
jgi:sugar lactone lactonase YvrE